MKTRNEVIGMGTALGVGVLLCAIISAQAKRGTHKIIIQRGKDIADTIDEHIDRKFAQLEKRLNGLSRTLAADVPVG